MGKLIIPILFLLAGCGFEIPTTINEADIVGDWRVVSCNIEAPSLSPSFIKMANDAVLSTSYQIRADHSMTMFDMHSVNGASATWVYVIDCEEIQIEYLKDSERGTANYQVSGVNGDEMVWISEV
ncbi:MAG: hypothetical protein HRT71_05910 [Flavobacteriales bacterium]|nr:hypothetical protein [Flavobacteriales bacterium]